jgi:simple sugar transport system substrate-binding protein
MVGSRAHRSLALLTALALTASAVAVTGGAVAAQDDAKFCTGTNIVFFPGGAEGGPFETVVYNGAKAAQDLFGPTVAYQWSGWIPETMITQFQEAVATQPDGIAIMGHPGDEAFGPLIDDAVAQGIIVTVMNTELPQAQAKYASQGTGYVGQTLYKAGSDLAMETVKRGGLVAGDKVFVYGLLSQPGRGERTRGILEGLVQAGLNEEDVIYQEMDDATNSDSTLGIPVFTGIASSNPDLKAAIFDHGNMTATAQSYLEAAGLGPDDIYVSGFDLAPATVAAIKSGFTDLVIDQQQWLQGFEAIAQICLSHNYGFSGLFINTGGGFADASNVDQLAPLVDQQIR